MKFSEEWNSFVENLTAHALGTYRNSNEYAYYKHRQKDMDEILSNSLLEEEKAIVDQILFEIESRTDRESQIVYRQGLRDSVAILRILGVLG